MVGGEREKRFADEAKAAMKEALKEWLNEQFNTFDTKLGKYVRHVFVAVIFYLCVHALISFRFPELRQILIDEFAK